MVPWSHAHASLCCIAFVLGVLGGCTDPTGSGQDDGTGESDSGDVGETTDGDDTTGEATGEDTTTDSGEETTTETDSGTDDDGVGLDDETSAAACSAFGDAVPEPLIAMVEPFYNGQARVERLDGSLVVIDELGEVVELQVP